jgi:hypothetical protein
MAGRRHECEHGDLPTGLAKPTSLLHIFIKVKVPSNRLEGREGAVEV